MADRAGGADRMSDALEPVRVALLAVHRALVDDAREEYEREHGAISGPEFLRLLLEDLRYAWLRPLSELVIQIDEAQTEPADEGRAEELLDAARTLLVPPSPGTAFGRRYADALQRRPEVVVAHGAVVQALRG
jgi:hypothetical protein